MGHVTAGPEVHIYRHEDSLAPDLWPLPDSLCWVVVSDECEHGKRWFTSYAVPVGLSDSELRDMFTNHPAPLPCDSHEPAAVEPLTWFVGVPENKGPIPAWVCNDRFELIFDSAPEEWDDYGDRPTSDGDAFCPICGRHQSNRGCGWVNITAQKPEPL